MTVDYNNIYKCYSSSYKSRNDGITGVSSKVKFKIYYDISKI